MKRIAALLATLATLPAFAHEGHGAPMFHWHATDTAVNASISTPVGPVTLTLASTRQPGSLSSGAMSSVTLDSASG